MLEFDKNEIIKIKDKAVAWIRDWFESNGNNCNAIIGISGGKDSSIVAALCAEALGKDRVIGVLMPNDNQADINDAFDLVNFLGIRSITTDIHMIVDDAINAIQYGIYDLALQDPNSVVISEQTKVNLPARIRMTMLYAIAQSNNGRVANTCNRSENYLGYSTLWGDDVGDFSPLGELTCNEVIAIGEILGLPDRLIHKAPSDGLTGKTDEDNFGFSYDEVDAYLLKKGTLSTATTNKISSRHCNNYFKRVYKILPTFDRSMCNNFTGVRHDSGNPYEWGEKIIAHWQKYGIDPKTKTLLFSDSLDFDKAQAIYDYFKDRTNVSFGIGTFVSNDTGAEPLNIVIKLQYVNGRPVAKVSDCPGKAMSKDEDYLKYLKEAINFRIEREKE